MEETVYGKWVNLQGLWNRLTASTLPIAHVSLTVEWYELEHGCQPGTYGLHAAHRLVLSGLQSVKSKLHNTARSFLFHILSST
jgi:hypothetical protein